MRKLYLVLAALVLIAFVAVIVGGCNQQRLLRRDFAIDAKDDSYIYNGADLIFYSDNHTTQKLSIDGATGDLTVGGALAVTGAQTGAGATFTGKVQAQDLQATRNITAATLITSTGDVSAGDDVTAESDVTAGGNVSAVGSLSGASASVTGKITAQDVSVTRNLTVTNYLSSTTGLDAPAGTLKIAGRAFSGAIKFGITAGEIVSGATIAHGMGTTPTVAIVCSSNEQYTGTVGVLSLNATNITVSVIAPDGATEKAWNLFWMAGK